MKPNQLFPILLMICFLSGFNQSSQAAIFYPKMDSIQVYFDDNQLLLPGESFRIGVISYFKNGKIKRTVGMDGGSVIWWRYNVDVIGGKDFSGRILVNEELVPSKGKYIELKISPRKQPELMKELLLPLNYETKITYRPVAGFDKAPGSQVKGEYVKKMVFRAMNCGASKANSCLQIRTTNHEYHCSSH